MKKYFNLQKTINSNLTNILDKSVLTSAIQLYLEQKRDENLQKLDNLMQKCFDFSKSFDCYKKIAFYQHHLSNVEKGIINYEILIRTIQYLVYRPDNKIKYSVQKKPISLSHLPEKIKYFSIQELAKFCAYYTHIQLPTTNIYKKLEAYLEYKIVEVEKNSHKVKCLKDYEPSKLKKLDDKRFELQLDLNNLRHNQVVSQKTFKYAFQFYIIRHLGCYKPKTKSIFRNDIPIMRILNVA